MSEDNRVRALAEVASLDAWRQGFTSTRKAAALHVDVAFTEGRIGGQPGDPVRFRLRLRRATVVVVVPPFEKLVVDRASVSRDAPSVKIKASETRRSKTKLGGGMNLLAKAGLGGAAANGSARATAGAEHVREKALKITEEMNALSVMQVMTPAGDYAWIVEPAVGKTLVGRPWDAKAKPRMKVHSSEAGRLAAIDPAIRVELRCRREDLDIQDVVPTDKRDLAALAGDVFRGNKLRAVEGLIRTRLAKAGLLHGDLEDPYAEIVLCAVIAQEG